MPHTDRRGFSYIEVMITLVIVSLMGGAIFWVQQFLSGSFERNRDEILFDALVPYHERLLRQFALPDYCHQIPGQKCYLANPAEDQFTYVTDPSFSQVDPWFFPAQLNEFRGRYTQEIRYVGNGTIPGTNRTYDLYSVKIGLGELVFSGMISR